MLYIYIIEYLSGGQTDLARQVLFYMTKNTMVVNTD